VRGGNGVAVDKKIVEQLVYDYGGRLYTFCRRLAFTQTDADDLYQQTYIRILDMPGTIDLTNNPAGFLMSVAARIWRDEQKKYARRSRIAPLQSKENAVDEIPEQKLTEALLEKKQEQTAVRGAIEHLSEPLRAPVLLYYMGNLSVKEIAKALHITQVAVKSRLHQARQKLRSELEGMGYDR
jgi:RNA polymerase sigma-70 factor (ECF subfamily)